MSAPQPATETVVFVNGRLWPAADAHVSALDRGFTLGDGVFETMRARGDRVLFLGEHLARLAQGAAVLGLPAPPEPALREAVESTLRANGLSEAVVRLTVTGGIDTGRGLDPSPDAAPTVVVRVTPFVPPQQAYRDGITAIVATIRRNETSPLSRIKSCNYGDSVLARREARERGAAEALLLNTAGDVACAAAGNVMVVRNSMLYTPPVSSGVLLGVTRRAVLDLARQAGIPFREEPFDLPVLHGADEAFLTNTIAGVMPLTHLHGRAIGDGAPGAVTQTLALAYDRLVQRQW